MQIIKGNYFKALFSFILTVAIILFTFQVIGVKVNAVNYSGSGTKADPYLVTNAEQLQGMRENLLAHYKLAATIDLSGVEFKSIGRLDNPFLGSFVCELNSDKTPKYIIKNLKIKVKETAYSVEKKNKWEAALFGAADGAMFSGIYLIDVNISNDVLGDNRGAVQYGNFKPGMDEMNAAALLGDGTSCTITNCASTGSIDAKASGVGGLVGRLHNSTVEKCYSTVDVKTLGKWHVGGLVGYLKDSTANCCYATGNVSGGQTNIGGFAGCAEGGSITNCYSTGDVSGGMQTKISFAATQEGNEVSSSKYKNCYAIGTVKGDNSPAIQNKNTENCFVLKGTKHFMTGFKEETAANIKKAFSNLSEWDFSGKYPTIKGIGIVLDASKYAVVSSENNSNQTVSDKPQSSTSVSENPDINNSSTVVSSTTTVVSSESTTDSTVKQVEEMIKKLPEAEEGNITVEHKDAIKKAWEAYEKMSDIEKEDFDSTLMAKLMNCRLNVSMLIIGDWITAIENLPEKTELKPEHVEKIMELWDEYSFMDESLTEAVEKDVLKKLEEAHEYALDIKENGATIVDVTEVFSEKQKIIIYMCAGLLVGGVIFNVVALVVLLKKFGKSKAKEEIEEYEE